MRFDSLIMKGSNGQDLYLPELVSRATASGDASLEFALPPQYEQWILFFIKVIPETDAGNTRLRFSDDNGSSYYSTAGDYVFAGETMGTTLTGDSSTSAAQIRMNDPTVGNATGEGISGWAHIIQVAGSGYTKVISRTVHQDSGASPEDKRGGGQLEASTARVTHVQFSFSNGNIGSGEFALYGIPAVL